MRAFRKRAAVLRTATFQPGLPDRLKVRRNLRYPTGRKSRNGFSRFALTEDERERNRSGLNLIAIMKPCNTTYRSSVYARPVLAVEVFDARDIGRQRQSGMPPRYGC